MAWRRAVERRGRRDEMRYKGLWFVGGTGVAIATVLAYGSALSDLGMWSRAPGETLQAQIAASHSPAQALLGTQQQMAPMNVQFADVTQLLPTRETLHWPSLGIGFILAFLLQISWFELPRRIVRWLIANERNFYRIGIAGGCLAVLLFY
jgi:hypothetical protein